MIRAKNRFYRLLKLDEQTRATIKFYRNIKEKMLRDVNETKTKPHER